MISFDVKGLRYRKLIGRGNFCKELWCPSAAHAIQAAQGQWKLVRLRRGRAPAPV